MSGVSLPMIKVPHPSSRLGDPASIHVRGTSRGGFRREQTSFLTNEVTDHDYGGDKHARPSTVGAGLSLATGSPRIKRNSQNPETGRFSVTLSADRTKPIMPIFGNHAELASRASSRPNTSSSILGSGRIPLEEIERTLQEKIKTAYFSLRKSFISEDPESRGYVKRDSLLQILCNFLAMPLSLSQFNKLMMRLGLADKKIIGIDEFYSKFRPVKSSGEYPTWFDLRKRDCDKMTATQVHMNLKEKAREKVLDLSLLLPSGKSDGTGRVDKSELRNTLDHLGFRMSDKEYDKLWISYDPDQAGTISTSDFMRKLGISFDNGTGVKSSRTLASTPPESKVSPRLEKSKPSGSSLDLSKMLIKELRVGARDIYHAFLEVDSEKTGMVNQNQFRRVFQDYGISITDQQISKLWARSGLNSSSQINYADFLKRYQSRGEDGMIHVILNEAHHPYNQPKAENKENILTVADIEGKLLDLFQKDFMVLLATFRQFDRANSMKVTPKEFCLVLKSNFDINMSEGDLQRLIPDLPRDEHGDVLYMDFIARFDSRERKSLFDTRSMLPNAHKPRDSQSTAGLDRVHTGRSAESRPSTYESRDGRSVEELTELIKHVVKDNHQAIQEEFFDADEYNTNKLKPGQLQSLLEKFDLRLSSNELKRVWDTFITNQDGSLQFSQFIRHFIFSMKSAAYPNAKISPPKRGDSDFKVCSKKLNSDFHMLEDALKTKIILQFDQLHFRFANLDRDDSGVVSKEDFKDILHDLCIEMTDNECTQLCEKYDVQKNNKVAWKEFLRPYAVRQQIYRQGNNMSGILSHGEKIENGVKNGLLIPKGLPSLTQKIRERLSGDWRTLRRAFRRLDQHNQGYLTIEEFKSVLKLCSVFLDDEELYQLSSELDSNLEGKIPYREFLNRAMTSMSTSSWNSTIM